MYEYFILYKNYKMYVTYNFVKLVKYPSSGGISPLN